MYHKPAQKQENRPDRDPPGAVIDAVGGQSSVQTLVQTLHPFFAYTQRSRYGPSQ